MEIFTASVKHSVCGVGAGLQVAPVDLLGVSLVGPVWHSSRCRPRRPGMTPVSILGLAASSLAVLRAHCSERPEVVMCSGVAGLTPTVHTNFDGTWLKGTPNHPEPPSTLSAGTAPP